MSTEPGEGPASDTVTVRPEAPGDHAVIAQVVEQAFGSPGEARLVEAIRASPQYVPDLALVAEVAGTVVGHVMISGATLLDEDGRGDAERRVASLSPLAVAPEHQRSGIGSALVRAVCARAAELGEPLVILEGSPDYYGRFGFEPAYAYGIGFDLPSWAPPEAGQVLWLTAPDPAVRGRVTYPPSFDVVLEHDR